MPELVDASLKTDKWLVERMGETIRFTNRKSPKRTHEKTYASIHAANCAYGRIRGDHSMAERIINNIKVAEIRGTETGRSQRRMVRSDYLLFCAIDMLVEQGGKKADRAQIETEVFDRCKGMIRKDHTWTGINDLRSKMKEANTEIHAELKKD